MQTPLGGAVNPLAQVDTHTDVALMQTPSRGVNPHDSS